MTSDGSRQSERISHPTLLSRGGAMLLWLRLLERADEDGMAPGGSHALTAL